MKSIYKSPAGKRAILDTYDRQLKSLGVPWRDRYVDTAFGPTHVVECGNPAGPPLLVFHGGNATTAYNLLCCRFLLEDFHLYGADTIGHPGKSGERRLSPAGPDYGRWAAQVIEGLGYASMACFGGSFGGGIVVKLLCEAPHRVERAALLVPAALKNAPAFRSLSMAAPMALYWLTHREAWFRRCLLPMALAEDNLSADMLETARRSIDHGRIAGRMPCNEPPRRLANYQGPVLVMAAEKDCLFPGKRVLAQAAKVWPQSQRYLLEGRGHIHRLTAGEERRIADFLLSGPFKTCRSCAAL